MSYKTQHQLRILGNKADAVLQKAYRNDIGNPEDVKHSQLGTPGLSGSGGSAR
jgi:hypothetical protein